MFEILKLCLNCVYIHLLIKKKKNNNNNTFLTVENTFCDNFPS